MRYYIVPIFISLLLFSGCVPADTRVPPGGKSYVIYQQAYFQGGGVYPIFSLTPGDVLTTNVTLICQVGYSASVRDVPQSLKDEVYAEYNITSHLPYEYEVDHLISLELGGSNDIKNLWPEKYNMTLGARQKDVVENYLHKEVCNNRMDITYAQNQIVTNWTEIYKVIKYG